MKYQTVHGNNTLVITHHYSMISGVALHTLGGSLPYYTNVAVDSYGGLTVHQYSFIPNNHHPN